MRVIAGRLGGRLFDSPGGHRTHPMSDKVRGGLFNVLGDITGLTVLDAFTGSGALSFEAISRGALACVAIDIDKRAITTLVNSLKQFHLEGQIQAIRASAAGYLQTQPQAAYDIVLCDPPYDDLQPALLERLSGRVKPGGIFVLSCPGQMKFRRFEALEPLSQKSYGDAQLLFYRRSG